MAKYTTSRRRSCLLIKTTDGCGGKLLFANIATQIYGQAAVTEALACECSLWAYFVEKLQFWPKFENNSPHSATMILRRGDRQKEGLKRCCVSLEPCGAIFFEHSQRRAFGGVFRNPLFRVFQQNRLGEVVRRLVHQGPEWAACCHGYCLIEVRPKVFHTLIWNQFRFWFKERQSMGIGCHCLGCLE